MKSHPVRLANVTLAAAVFLIGVVLLPTFPFYFGVSSSLALGSLALGVGIIFLSWSSSSSRTTWRFSPAAVALIFVSLIVCHILVASALLPTNLGRAFVSFVPLAVLIIAGAHSASLLSRVDDDMLHRLLLGTSIMMLLLAVLGVAGVAPTGGRLFEKPVFPFTEPSHFALMFTPFLAYSAVQTCGVIRFAILAVGITLAILLKNLSLTAGVFVAVAICYRTVGLVAAAVIVAILVPSSYVDYFVARLDFSEFSQNLSALVYLQGWELLIESLGRTSAWGLGFQQLGVSGTNVESSARILEIVDTELNLLDGGFTLSKIGSELGIFGLALCIYYVYLVGQSYFALRFADITPTSEVFAHCVIVSYVLDLFARGVGYFSGSSLLVLSALWLLAGKSRVPDIHLGQATSRVVRKLQ